MSQKDIRYHRLARVEAAEAYRWYREKNPTVATQFRQALRDANETIARDPDVWPFYHLETRCYRLRKFPYLVIYVEDQDAIFILAVAHMRRRPNYWIDRLGR